MNSQELYYGWAMSILPMLFVGFIVVRVAEFVLSKTVNIFFTVVVTVVVSILVFSSCNNAYHKCDTQKLMSELSTFFSEMHRGYALIFSDIWDVLKFHLKKMK